MTRREVYMAKFVQIAAAADLYALDDEGAVWKLVEVMGPHSGPDGSIVPAAFDWREMPPHPNER